MLIGPGAEQEGSSVSYGGVSFKVPCWISSGNASVFIVRFQHLPPSAF